MTSKLRRGPKWNFGVLSRFGALVASVWLSSAPHCLLAQINPTAQSLQILQGDEAFLVGLEVMLLAGDQKGALALLRSNPALAANPDGLKLQAQLLLALNEPDQALGVLESLLSETPSDALARFQVGEAHFMRKRDRAAETAYRLALAGDLDAARAGLARQRLIALSQNAGWQGSVSALIAPDSNLNSATQDRSIEIFGLPFELDENARATSGLSASLHAQIGRSLPLIGQTRIAGTIAGSFTDTPNRNFDEAWIQARLGPEWRFSNEGRLSLQWVEASRWFGGALFETTSGVRGEASFAQGPVTRWDVSARLDHATNRQNVSRSGQSYIMDLGRTRFLNASNLWRFGATYAKRDANSPVESFDAISLSTGRLRPGPFKTSLYIEPYISYRDFKAASFAFGTIRQDLETGVTARVTRRSLAWRGWSPFISATASRADSTLIIGRYSRTRIEFGLTQSY